MVTFRWPFIHSQSCGDTVPKYRRCTCAENKKKNKEKERWCTLAINKALHSYCHPIQSIHAHVVDGTTSFTSIKCEICIDHTLDMKNRERVILHLPLWLWKSIFDRFMDNNIFHTYLTLLRFSITTWMQWAKATTTAIEQLGFGCHSSKCIHKAS